jgi:methionyl-tRNA synthetase
VVRELKKGNVIITAALPYANADLHLGHITSTYLPADILYRYLKLAERKAVQICASDDYGTPILISSEKEGKPPSEYVAERKKRFEKDLRSLGIEYDLFGNTSSKENVRFVQAFFKDLHKGGHVYQKDVDQFYCEFDRKFLPDRYVKGTCPYCGTKDQYSDGCENCGRTLQPGQILNPRCSICGRVPVTRKSDHYFFKLSALAPKLEKWLRSNANLQPEPRNYVLSWIKEGLQDWDISRDIDWGVPIPLKEAKGKVFYGWFDNHLCYIATALKEAGKSGKAGVTYWNGSTVYHFIGKDIVYHHYLFLPGMRIAQGDYSLPDFIPTRGYLLIQGKKISKSRNWFISVKDFVSWFPGDYLRFYLTRITPYAQTDLNFDWDEFRDKVNNELIANVGNFVYRTLVFTRNKHGGSVPKPVSKGADETAIVADLKRAASEATRYLDEGNYDRALKAVLDFSSRCNQYFQKKAPWENSAQGPTAIYYSCNLVANLAILLFPFLPVTSTRILEQVLPGKHQGLKWSDAGELFVPAGSKIKGPEPLFKKIEDGEIALRKANLPA